MSMEQLVLEHKATTLFHKFYMYINFTTCNIFTVKVIFNMYTNTKTSTNDLGYLTNNLFFQWAWSHQALSHSVHLNSIGGNEPTENAMCTSASENDEKLSLMITSRALLFITEPVRRWVLSSPLLLAGSTLTRHPVFQNILCKCQIGDVLVTRNKTRPAIIS